jgi:lysophospholipase L1-like esterase
MKNLNAILILAFTLLSCKSRIMNDTITKETASASTGQSTKLTYLALGDSYTIGESVAAVGSFPYQLAAQLNKNGYKTGEPTIIARTGWTTDELIQAINANPLTQKFDIVTLLIGVNNQYRHYDINTYRTEFVQLLNTAVTYANGNKKHVFVISIPDWGATPFAAGQDRAQIAMEIDQYNAINLDEAANAGVNYTDITPSTRQVTHNSSLYAADGLHPSPKLYNIWLQKLLPTVLEGMKH